jgi:glyoxylase-like metal-dependent hydrolase (beta-lactamase superfamily II)
MEQHAQTRRVSDAAKVAGEHVILNWRWWEVSEEWWQAQPRAAYAKLARVHLEFDWFEAYRISDGVFALYEPGQCEEAISTLIVGQDRAALVDSGCGIGDLRAAVSVLTDKPVMVINTHTHLDHVGGNRQFDEIAMFDHPWSRRLAAEGASQAEYAHLLEPGMLSRALPVGFDAERYELPPFTVALWLRDGDLIDLGDRSLEVIHTPGEAPDHVCVLDAADRLLCTGDLYCNGGIWAHLPGGDPQAFPSSYRRLLSRADEFDLLMPSHNEPAVPTRRLQEALGAIEAILAGEREGRAYTDLWGECVREYSFDGFSFTLSQ